MHRRDVLFGLGALLGTLALPGFARAEPLLAPLADAAQQAEREALIAHVRDKLLGFDVLDLADRALEDLRHPRRREVLAQASALLDGHDLTRGFRSIQNLSQDRETARKLRALVTRELKRLSTKRWLLRLAKRIPADPAARQALVEHVYSAWLGLDMARLRAHVASLDRDDLAIVYGPVTTLLEAGSLIIHEPLALYLQIIHGRRAREHFLDGASPRRELLRALIDPAVSHIALIGHGDWQGFSLRGWYSNPTAMRDYLADRLRADPKGALKELAGPMYRSLASIRYNFGELGESDLAAAIAALYPEPDRLAAVQKTLIVRHTCGHNRYSFGGSALAWSLFDESQVDGIGFGNEGFSGARPEHVGTYEAAVEAFVAKTTLKPVERSAFGACLTREPSATRGYEGYSWLANFLEDPIPAWMPPHRPWAPEGNRSGEPVEGEPGGDP